jgi:hypothetical protein
MMKSLSRDLRIPSSVMFLLLAGCGGSASPPSQLSKMPAGLNDPKLELAGIYQDGWVGETGSATLQQPKGDQALTVRGMVPNLGSASFQTTLELRVDGTPVGSKTVGPGDFQISAPAPPTAGNRRVTLSFSPLQELPNGDGRLVGARLQFLGFEPASNVTAPLDITRGPGIELGSGWGVMETFKGETFRWVENDARIRLTGSASTKASLSMIVEPGPGVSAKPFPLKVYDESGKQVAVVQVTRRGAVKVTVPLEAGRLNEFRLHVDGGGKPAKNDPRIMNFRLFRLEIAPS